MDSKEIRVEGRLVAFLDEDGRLRRVVFGEEDSIEGVRMDEEGKVELV